jgi:hypothetical protein
LKNNDDIEIIELDSSSEFQDQQHSKATNMIDIIWHQNQRKNIRPFDPCPCWSWKPYIQCCWKKKK